MTTTETTANDTWTDELAALNLLLTDPNISDDDARARAAMRAGCGSRGRRSTAPGTS